jgi:hypothetical protein
MPGLGVIRPVRSTFNRRGATVSEPFYVSRVAVAKVEGVHRRATLEMGTTVDFGVHGAIREHYGLAGPDRPLPVDYVVASAVG